MTVKFEVFTQLTDVSKAQRLMKESLALAAGKGDVKFVAAKNYKIGGKLTSLFLVVDTSTQSKFLEHLKKQGALVAASAGVAEVTKSTTDATHKIVVKSAKGSLSANIVSTIVKPAVGNDAHFHATTPEREQAEAEHRQSEETSGTKPKTTQSGSLPESVFSEIKKRGQKDDAPLPGEGARAAVEQGGKLQKSGAPEWAKKNYKIQAKRMVIASMTPDGKIGSIYFDDGSRIRTTHGVSPTGEQHDKNRSVQFNVDEGTAQKEYLLRHPEDGGFDGYDDWLKERLTGITPSNAPKWATIIDSPLKAHDKATKGNPTGSETLIEIFKSVSGEYQGWHPSRGTATRFDTDKQTISVLRAALKHIDGLYPKPDDWAKSTPEVARIRNLRNQEFYKFVKSRSPESEIVKAMRKPEEV